MSARVDFHWKESVGPARRHLSAQVRHDRQCLLAVALCCGALVSVEHRLRSCPAFQAAVGASQQGERQRAIKREPPALKPPRFGAGALPHRFGYPSLAALSTRREFPPLDASPRNPLAPPLD